MWARRLRRRESRGDFARISGVGGGFCHHGVAGDRDDGVAGQIDAQWVGKQGRPEPEIHFREPGLIVSGGAAGGYVTALVAAANPLIHVLALGIMVLALAALSALQAKGKQPIWYQLRWWRFRRWA